MIFGWLNRSKPAAVAPMPAASQVAWAAELYDVAVWRAPISGSGWHDWSIWHNLMQPIGAVLDHAGGQTSLHSFQTGQSKSDWLPFGRMVWNEASNRKWCTRYRAEASTVFNATEVWAPGRKQALTGGQGPQVFVHLENFARSEIDSQTLKLAVRCGDADKGFDQACEAISAVLTSAEFKCARRPWAEAVHSSSYTNGLRDVFGHFLFDELQSVDKQAADLTV
jgi:hypothetical protein